MSFGWANGWYSGLATDLDGKIANAVGHTIETTLCYLTPGWDPKPQTPAAWVTALSTSPSAIRPFYYDMMVPWGTAAVPKRDLSITVDIAPYAPSGPGGNWASGPGTVDSTAITNWHTDMNAGLYDNAWIAFANMLTSTGLANAHVRPWHEPAWWNFWTSTVDYAGWLAAFNRMIGVFRAHGLTGRMGPSLDGVSSSNYLSSTFTGSDCVYFDTYTNAAPGSAISPTVVSYCRSKGMVLNLNEVGIYSSADSDARGVQFFTEVHDWILANQDVYEGMVFYNDNGSADILTGSYPNTLAYIRHNMATWEISATPGGGGGGTTGTNTASVTSSGTTAHFSGTVASNVLNVPIYRDTYGGTKIADVTPSGGNYSYDKTGETDGAHRAVVVMFDSAAGTPGTVQPPSPFTLDYTIDSSTPAGITNRWTAQTASGTNGSSLSGLNWSTLSAAPQSTTVAYLTIAIGSGASTPDLSGLTYPFTFHHRTDNGTQVGLAHYTRACTGTETGAIPISIVGSAQPSGLMHAVLMGKEGVDRTTPVDVYADSNTFTTGPTVTIPSITPTKAGVLLIGSAFVVKYGSATSFSWTPSASTTEIADLFGLEAGAHGKSLEVVEHLQSAQTATGANVETWGSTYSYGVATALGLRPAAALPPTQSMSNFTVTKDLGVVAISIATITSGITQVKAYEGAVLQGTAAVAGSAATINLDPQSVGAHIDSVYGYDANGVQQAGPYSVSFTVLAAPLISNANPTLNNVRINANAVTTTIRVYRTIADGGALVTSHAVDASLGWDYTSSSTGYVAGRDYDATAWDGTHESARFRFTTVTAPATPPSIDSVNVDNSGLATIIWQGSSLRLFSGATVLDTVTTGQPRSGGLVGYLYTTSPGAGSYTVTAYNTADPAAATQSNSAPVVIGTPTTGGGGAQVGQVIMVGGSMLVNGTGAIITAG